MNEWMNDNVYWGCQLHLNQWLQKGPTRLKSLIKIINYYLQVNSLKNLHDKSFKKWWKFEKLRCTSIN